MNLVPFSSQDLRLKEPLPFGLHDESGQVLLPAGQGIETEQQLHQLAGQELFVDEAASSDWRAQHSTPASPSTETSPAVEASADETGYRRTSGPTLSEQWEDLTATLDTALREAGPEGDWLQRLESVHVAARQLAEQRLDASLFHLFHLAAQVAPRYSARHGLLVMTICEQVARLMKWEPTRLDAIGHAALTMNVVMVRLQDLLAQTEREPTPEMRAAIATHAQRGADLLSQCGVSDALWLGAVAHHHRGADGTALDQQPMERQLAHLLHRVDVFTAKLSRRRTRAPLSPLQAARQVCLSQDGRPDAIGSALLKAVGLYPPGSFVELACGELGVVIARGETANMPRVVALVTAVGTAFAEPTLRNTAESDFKVRGCVAESLVKSRLPHERVLALV